MIHSSTSIFLALLASINLFSSAFPTIFHSSSGQRAAGAALSRRTGDYLLNDGIWLKASKEDGDNKDIPEDLDSAESFEEGALLAKELYQRVREMDAVKKQVNKDREEYLRQVNSEPFRRRKEMSSSGPKENVKRDQGRNDNPFFSSEFGGNDDSSSMFGNNNDSRSNRSQRRRSSINGGSGVSSSVGNNFLLDTASSERNILIQIVVVSLLLAFAIGVGLNGGITDGSERVVMDEMGSPGEGMENLLDSFTEGASSSPSEDSVFI